MKLIPIEAKRGSHSHCSMISVCLWAATRTMSLSGSKVLHRLFWSDPAVLLLNLTESTVSFYYSLRDVHSAAAINLILITSIFGPSATLPRCLIDGNPHALRLRSWQRDEILSGCNYGLRSSLEQLKVYLTEQSSNPNIQLCPGKILAQTPPCPSAERREKPIQGLFLPAGC